jgi:hypothetical protein
MINENYFDKIDTQDNAYWLGFLYADGYVNKSNRRLQLCLAIEDEEVIDKFMVAIGDTNGKKKYYGPYKSNRQIQVHYYINSKLLVSGLIKHGCTNKKSKTIRFPVLETKELQLTFLSGYYDGDGSNGDNRTDVTCGAFLFLEDIKKLFGLPYVLYKTNNVYETYRLNLGHDLYREMVVVYKGGMDRKKHNLDNSLSLAEYKQVLQDIKDKKETKSTNIITENHIKEIKHNLKKRGKQKRKFEVSKEELEKLVHEMPMTAIAKMFGVSDKAVAKRCKVLEIDMSFMTKGYWTKHKTLV